MVLAYLRHGDDNGEDITFAHDAKLVKEGESDIIKVGKFLVEKYGQPHMIICSPFQRAKETYTVMRKKDVFNQECKFFADTRVGRYFSSREKEAGPEVRKETLKMKPSIYE